MKHFTALNLVIITLIAITATPLAASAQEEAAGIIETHGYAAGGLDYLADTTDELANELAGIIETNGYVAPEELADFNETLGYVLDDLAREADMICARTLAGGGGIGLEGGAQEIAVMAMGTGAIGFDVGFEVDFEVDDITFRPRDSGAISIHGGEWIGSSYTLGEAVYAVVHADLPEGDADSTLRTARQLTSFLDQVARATATR